MAKKWGIKYRNKMYGYKAYFILDETFDTKLEAKKWVAKNKVPYIDKIEIKEYEKLKKEIKK